MLCNVISRYVIVRCVISRYVILSSKLGCRCIKTTSQRVALRTVAKVEVTPPSGRCPGDVSICNIFRITSEIFWKKLLKVKKPTKEPN
uniref:Chemokine interleukin-8-like domain-containing protein n=1 Tax=Poecilia reticulata TaxID=8081 RepID=A0A3P9N6V5_POERE